MSPVSLTRDGVRAADPALDALFTPFDGGELAMPKDDDVLFLRARPGPWMHRPSARHWHCMQSFKPHADALHRYVAAVEQTIPDSQHELILVLPPRQRDESRALLAQAMECVKVGGTVIVSVANNEGARSVQDDLERLAGPLQQLSKHKCRVFWTTPESQLDRHLQIEWQDFDNMQPIGDGWVSRPGLFAWNRIDAASALLASQLPTSLRGSVADLGAGFGYLSGHVLRHCTAATRLDLYEGEARALEPARHNLQRIAAEIGRSQIPIDVIWHDVASGLPSRYDVIVSNPPFHQGRADLPGLGQRFIDVAADALNPGGELWLVANRHLPYEITLKQRFDQVRTVAQSNGFKVFHAHGVHR